MKTFIIIALFLIFWVIFAQSCLRLRTSDSSAKNTFQKAGTPITFHNISVNKRNLHYVQTGKDTCPTIVFIHGSPGSWDAFEKYLLDKDLCKKFRLISIDRPGFGYSDFGSSLDLSEQSMIISPLFQLIQNQKPIYLVGHSLGGPMIVQLAADNPNTFKRLVIISGAIDVSLEPAEKWRPLFMNNPLKFLLPGAFKPSNEELWYLKKDLILMKPMFAKINCTVHILHGNKDQFVDYGNLAFGAKAFVNAPSIDTITFQGANHFIPWTKFEEIKKVLMKLY